jgi:uncharacterized protein YraI
MIKKRDLQHWSGPILAIYLIIGLTACRSDGTELVTPVETITISAEESRLSREAPYVIISSPADGQQFEQGQTIRVLSESVDELGIVRLDLLINHQVLHADQYLPEPGSALVTKQSWTPSQPGTYTVQVRAYNPADVVGQSQQIVVQVIPAVSITVTETPTTTPSSPTNTPTIIFSLLPTTTPTPSPPPPTATPTRVPPYLQVSVQPGLNVRTGPSTRYRTIGLLEPGDKAEILGQNNIGAGRWWQIQFDQAPGGVAWVSASADYSAAFNVEQVPVVPPPPTPVLPTPTSTPTSAPVKPTIVFGADRTQIKAGECVTIYWNVANVKEVYYRGQGVAGENQSRLECPSLTEYFELRAVNLDGTIDTNTIKIEVEGGGYRAVEIDEGESVDFDDEAEVSDDGDDFEWVKVSGERRFRKWDDDGDLKLIPVGPVDSLDLIRRQDCEWALDNLDDEDYIKPFGGLAACIRTDDGRLGKIRFENSDEEVDIEWALW